MKATDAFLVPDSRKWAKIGRGRQRMNASRIASHIVVARCSVFRLLQWPSISGSHIFLGGVQMNAVANRLPIQRHAHKVMVM
jgi:hypothetical protein